ncbi:PE-PPE domain-containing protein [Candidatus Mycobacterium wuenschmannii]|uniref:PE-PPE domain-containing protein n=1 Tax=Candidatus Mycobacterium wuenschmannii TaxID=3027808 RepID=A0ABY8VY87_9MYCO|nr:PE-PPE domain-containing protein [Candidatus Mycobacterium wuenschmannii]WIM87764.1 PE-PPE domain-containing protein [Candidatus Mycobacterium wuenschmannii]
MTTAVRTRSMSAVVLAAACATAIGMTPAVQSGLRTLATEVGLAANLGWIMGGTGNPIPDSNYLGNVETLYLNDSYLPNADSYSFVGLTTPEQFCPIICSPDQPYLTFGDSVDVGVGNLNTTVLPALADNEVSVLGYSQSATVATVWMNQLIDSNNPNLDNLHVTLLGDPNNVVSGILDRFQFADGTHLPFLNIPLDLSPTPTEGIDTDVFIGQYDGWNSFPSDPSNLYAVLNALIGIQTVHPYYPDPEAGVNLDIGNVIDLGKIGDTNFYSIPAPLPTLAFMYDGGPVGRFFYDSFSPYATLMNNWAYGNPGDPFVGVNGTDAIGPWQVDAYGQLMESGVAGFFLKMDPLQMLAGMQYAAAQTIIGPTNDILSALGQPDLSPSVVDSLMSGYDFTNQLDTMFLAQLEMLSATFPSLAPDVLFDGSPLISAQPLIDLVGYGFDIFNGFGA